jgi:enoyl-CoA hydratase/carnithine racemase
VTDFNTYANAYSAAKCTRDEGILEVTLGTNGGPLIWGEAAHREMQALFGDISRDRENRVVVLTGSGDAFISHMDSAGLSDLGTAEGWDKIYWEGRRMLQYLLEIEAPIICAINGPVREHSEIALLSDIVLASETTIIQDGVHFLNNLVPGDGVNIFFPMLMGLNRGRYFLLMGQEITAHQALELGLVSEVLSPDKVLQRAREIAKQFNRRSALTLKYTRIALTQQLRKLVLSEVGHGLMLEGAAFASVATPEFKFLPGGEVSKR